MTEPARIIYVDQQSGAEQTLDLNQIYYSRYTTFEYTSDRLQLWASPDDEDSILLTGAQARKVNEILKATAFANIDD